MTNIEKAIAQAGGQTALARRLGITQAAVSRWVKRGYVPMRRVEAVSRLTGVAPRELMHPAVNELFAGE